MPTNPTNATDAVQRDGVQSVRAALLYRDAFFPHRDYDQEEVEPRHGHIIWADLRALLARLADVEAERDGLRVLVDKYAGIADQHKSERDALLAENASLREDKARLLACVTQLRVSALCEDWHTFDVVYAEAHSRAARTQGEG